MRPAGSCACTVDLGLESLSKVKELQMTRDEELVMNIKSPGASAFCVHIHTSCHRQLLGFHSPRSFFQCPNLVGELAGRGHQRRATVPSFVRDFKLTIRAAINS
jgi:hypothetical protein